MTEPAAMTTLLPVAAPARVLACGAYLKNRACRVDGGVVTWSAPHGDLSNPDACAALERAVDELLARGPVDAFAHDLHPDFHSTRVAVERAAALGLPAVPVQHHHAHVAALQAEHALPDALVGLALDGVGLGSDGVAWGGELLGLDRARWQRIGHLAPIALPGGDVAAREPWRLAAAVLHALGRGAEIEARFGAAAGAAAARTVRAMLERGLNCPASTGAGRWFDAAAGALGLSVRQAAEAEAAIALERCAAAWLADHPGFAHDAQGLDPTPWAAELLDIDPSDPDAVGRGAAIFHLSLVAALAKAAGAAARDAGVDTVAFSGGCFFNRILRERLGAALRHAGLRVATAADPGDAGLALGQAWVAAQVLQAGLPAAEQSA